MIVGDAKARTKINNTSARPRAESGRSPKNVGQQSKQIIQSVIIEMKRNEVIPLNGLQSL